MRIPQELHIYSEYKKSMLIIGLLGILAGFLEVVGISIIIPIFAIIFGSDSNHFVIDFISNSLKFLHIPETFEVLGVCIIVIFTVKTLIMYFIEYVKAKISSSFQEKSTLKLYDRLLGRDWKHIQNKSTGELQTLKTLSVKRGGFILVRIGDLIRDVSLITVYAISSFFISPKLTMVSLGLGLVVYIILNPLRKKISTVAEATFLEQKKSLEFASETILGVREIKLFGVEKEILKKIQVLTSELKRHQLVGAFLKRTVQLSLQPITIILGVLIMFIFFSNNPSPSDFAILGTIAYLMQRMISYTDKIQGFTIQAHDILPDVRQLWYFLEENKEEEITVSNLPTVTFKSKITFKNVYFGHGENSKAISNINFEIKKGDIVALYGKSGSGKTTLLDLVSGLTKPEQGQILVDGKNIQKINGEKWRDKITYVSQNYFILNDSIEANIRFFDNKYTEKEIEEAARKAGAYDFIINKKNGFETHIGKQGLKLSGGEKQRIVIARALLRKPEILLLDEATSGLDDVNETAILRTISQLKNDGVTVIIASHKQTNIDIADKVIKI